MQLPCHSHWVLRESFVPLRIGMYLLINFGYALKTPTPAGCSQRCRPQRGQCPPRVKWPCEVLGGSITEERCRPQRHLRSHSHQMPNEPGPTLPHCASGVIKMLCENHLEICGTELYFPTCRWGLDKGYILGPSVPSPETDIFACQLNLVHELITSPMQEHQHVKLFIGNNYYTLLYLSKYWTSQFSLAKNNDHDTCLPSQWIHKHPMIMHKKVTWKQRLYTHVRGSKAYTHVK